ncbi:uncharacterized protein LOC132704186 [Cylas formicarius]|uniref:uncharacterized protein LOC132704186 n=1 Tax=Cylas formicarius TaxID=197179 RepID=UPI002958BBF5|nr:uncharacterized protein LOC132704186 [Cylas formicarius]
MSLVADYGQSSNSSDSYESDNEVSKTEGNLTPFKLPTPNFEGGSFAENETKSSVFTNPFIEAEHAKEAILQKHVKMIDAKDVVVINGKKICWNYRKGRCRFGHNCKYAHDSDVQKTDAQLEVEKETLATKGIVCHSGGSNSSLARPTPQELEEIKEENSTDKRKRKRLGLTQGLVPGKKVMKHYLSHKS